MPRKGRSCCCLRGHGWSWRFPGPRWSTPHACQICTGCRYRSGSTPGRRWKPDLDLCSRYACPRKQKKKEGEKTAEGWEKRKQKSLIRTPASSRWAWSTGLHVCAGLSWTCVLMYTQMTKASQLKRFCTTVLQYKKCAEMCLALVPKNLLHNYSSKPVGVSIKAKNTVLSSEVSALDL